MSNVESAVSMIKGGMVHSKRRKRGQPKSLKGKVAKVSKELSLLKKDLKNTVEVKNFDGNLLTATLIDYAYSNVYNLFAPTQAVGINSRVGDSCYMTNLDLRFHVWNTSTTVLGQCRVIVFIDEDNSLALSNVFQTTSFINTINAPYAQYNRQYRKQFTVLYDEIHDLDAVSDPQNSVRVNLPIKKECVFVTGSTAITQNAIKIGFISNMAAAAPSTINATYAARIWFKDA